ncbi:metallophosphoesterase [Metabacillus sp. GX 13764]|uniref:metallophosphoesterase family protein n=1 Tax=Metabacillus kandeliae TaxID=2900151 RepID=UPI001E3E4106|nr:metallophosphoesterase [Metabacillus kandeliae]MCD7036511.1 metallophosphoesterase [Metabacillus kandeliae]
MKKHPINAGLIVLYAAFMMILPVQTQAASPEAKDGGIGEAAEHSEFSILNKKEINDIIYPLFSTPAIKKQGQTLTVKVDTHGKAPEDWQVKIQSPEQSPIKAAYSLQTVSAEKGSSYWKKDGTVYDVTVQIPEDVPENLYDLAVSYKADGEKQTDVQHHSVKVVKEFKKDFSFIHLTDIHVGSPRNLVKLSYAKEAGIWNPDESKRWLYLNKTIQEINLQKPDFVLLSGDLVFGQLNPGEYSYEYKEVFRVLQQLQVPVYIVPGNHDGYAQDLSLSDGLKYWNETFGPTYFSFDYGPYAHIAALNSFDWDKKDRTGSGTVSVRTWGGQVREEQMNWLKNDLAENEKKTSPEQMKILMSHNNPLHHDRDIWPSSDPEVVRYWKNYDEQHNPQTLSNLLLGEKLGIKYDQLWHGEGSKEILVLMKQYSIKLGVHGHTHEDRIDERDSSIFATTTSVELTGDPWVGYRTFQMKNGSMDPSYIYSGTENSVPVYQNGDTAAGVMSAQADYAGPNDGTGDSQTVTLTNRLNRAVTYHVPLFLTAGSYQATAGELKMIEENDGMVQMEAEITVPANSSQKTVISH